MGGAPVSASGGTYPPTALGTDATTYGSGTVTTPAANASIVALSPPAGGTYRITAYTWYGATGDTAGNMLLAHTGKPAVALPVQGGNNTAPQQFTLTAVLAATDSVVVTVNAAGAAGSIYWAALTLDRIG